MVVVGLKVPLVISLLSELGTVGDKLDKSAVSSKIVASLITPLTYLTYYLMLSLKIDLKSDCSFSILVMPST